METYTEQIRIQNACPRPMTVQLEPWGEQLPIAPDVTYEIVAKGPTGDCLHLTFGEERIIVWGWSGSVMSVFCDGRALATCEPPVPSTPPKYSPK